MDTPDDGPLHLRLTVTDGVASIQASGQAAGRLEEQRGALRSALASEGLSLGRLDTTPPQAAPPGGESIVGALRNEPHAAHGDPRPPRQPESGALNGGAGDGAGSTGQHARQQRQDNSPRWEESPPPRTRHRFEREAAVERAGEPTSPGLEVVHVHVQA